MIESKMKWYHYMMLPFTVQLVICMLSLMIIGIQLFIYDYKEKDIVVFEGVCEVTVGPMNDDGEPRRGATMMCGDEERYLGTLETPYLYDLLTYGEAPAIMCVKTESEFLKEIIWTCKFKKENDTDA